MSFFFLEYEKNMKFFCGEKVHFRSPQKYEIFTPTPKEKRDKFHCMNKIDILY